MDRFLLDKRFINYNDITLDIKKDNKKRKEMTNDDDIKSLPDIKNDKEKIKYPKNY